MAAFNSPEAAEYAMLDQIEAMLAGQSGEESLFAAPTLEKDFESPAMARIMMLHKQFTEEQAAEGFVAPNQTVSPSGTVSEVGESSLSFEIPEKLKPLREKVLKYMETWVYPLEALLHDEHNGLSPEARWQKIREAQAEAKKQDLWAIGHPVNLKGKGLPFMDYLFVNEVQGRSQLGQLCLGTYSLQDSLMMFRHGTEDQQRRYLARIVAGDIRPSFAMTEPDVSSSDPTQLKTTAQLVGDEWVINGRKWFTSGAKGAEYTVVMVRTEFDKPVHASYSMILVPTNTPGYNIVDDTHVLGISGNHCEVVYDNVRVPKESVLGPRGHGFLIAQERLGPGRIFHCMRWLGQMQRSFDLMCSRLVSRQIKGDKGPQPLGNSQLMQKHVFDSYCDIQSSRLMTLHAASKIDRGDYARVEIAAIKVFGAHALHRVVDRCVQVYGAGGLTERYGPISTMYREARFGRIYDGPDETHIINAAPRILAAYTRKATWDFGLK